MSQFMTWSAEDRKKILVNMAYFFAPGALLFLLAIQAGKSLEDAGYVLWYWVLATAIDMLKKAIATK